ncbi:MAG: alpha/beta fold hydrolase [Acidobacteriota bacterium]
MRMLLLHGFGGRGASWRPVIQALPDGLDVMAPDLPGHGGQFAGPLPADFEATVDALAAAHLAAADPTHVVGYSLGGRLALGLAFRRPEKISSLTLIGVRPGLDAADRCPRSELDRRRAQTLREDLPEFFKSWSRLPLFESQRSLDPSILENQRQVRLGHSPEGLAWAMETLSPGRMPDYLPRLGELTMPVHWITGAFDAPYLALADSIRRRGHAFRFSTVPECGHNGPLEAPAAVAGLLEESVFSPAPVPAEISA